MLSSSTTKGMVAEARNNKFGSFDLCNSPRILRANFLTRTYVLSVQNIKWRFNNKDKIKKVVSATTKTKMINEQAKQMKRREILNRVKANQSKRIGAQARPQEIEDKKPEDEE
jgi:hypothetical protein